MHYSTELNYSGKTYQLTFYKDSTESPGWMEVSSYIMPTVNLTCQLNRWFLDNYANEVLARWDKDHLNAFCTAIRMMGAKDADFARLGLNFLAETIEQKKPLQEEKENLKRRKRKKVSNGATSHG